MNRRRDSPKRVLHHPARQQHATTPQPAERPHPAETEASFRLGEAGEQDDLREELGEAFVQSVTSGDQAAEVFRDEELTEEVGGPFVETSGAVEFASGTDASNPIDAERAPFPTVSPERR